MVVPELDLVEVDNQHVDLAEVSLSQVLEDSRPGLDGLSDLPIPGQRRVERSARVGKALMHRLRRDPPAASS